MSIGSDPNVRGIQSNLIYYVISGIPLTPSVFMVGVPKIPTSSATQPIFSTRPIGTNLFRSLFGMQSHNSQSIPSVSNPFYFCMPNMTSQLSSSILAANLNPSFGPGGMNPPYVHISFGGGHIPQLNPTVGGWNPLSFKPNSSLNALGWGAQLGGKFTSYNSSFIPPFSMFILKNTFIMVNPPLSFGVPSGGIQFQTMGNPKSGFPSSGGNVYNHHLSTSKVWCPYNIL